MTSLTLQSFVQRKQAFRLILVLGDLVALLLFTYVGQRDHQMVNPENPVLGLLATGVNFILPWFIAGWLLDVFPDAEHFQPRSLLKQSLLAWLLAAPLGVLLRAYVLGRAVIPTMFMTAALGFGGLFVLGWRLIFIWWWRRYSLKAEQSRAVHQHS